jgi:hypothetical protein
VLILIIYISYKELLEEFKQVRCSVDRLFVLNRSFIYSLGHNEILQILTGLESHYLESIHTTLQKNVVPVFLSHKNSRKSNLKLIPLETKPAKEVSKLFVHAVLVS